MNHSNGSHRNIKMVFLCLLLFLFIFALVVRLTQTFSLEMSSSKHTRNVSYTSLLHISMTSAPFVSLIPIISIYMEMFNFNDNGGCTPNRNDDCNKKNRLYTYTYVDNIKYSKGRTIATAIVVTSTSLNERKEKKSIIIHNKDFDRFLENILETNRNIHKLRPRNLCFDFWPILQILHIFPAKCASVRKLFVSCFIIHFSCVGLWSTNTKKAESALCRVIHKSSFERREGIFRKKKIIFSYTVHHWFGRKHISIQFFFLSNMLFKLNPIIIGLKKSMQCVHHMHLIEMFKCSLSLNRYHTSTWLGFYCFEKSNATNICRQHSIDWFSWHSRINFDSSIQEIA